MISIARVPRVKYYTLSLAVLHSFFTKANVSLLVSFRSLQGSLSIRSISDVDYAYNATNDIDGLRV